MQRDNKPPEEFTRHSLMVMVCLAGALWLIIGAVGCNVWPETQMEVTR